MASETNYKRLFDKLEQHLAQIEQGQEAASTLLAIVTRLVEDFREELGLRSGRIYRRKEGEFVLEAAYPSEAVPLGIRVSLDYSPVQEVLRHGYVLSDRETPGIDREFERTLDADTFAAISVGETGQWLLSFSLESASDRAHVTYILNTIRHVVNLTLRKERLEANLEQARAIQVSLLPSCAPVFADYEVHGFSRPAEEVGGDLFDFVTESESSLGIAIADSAGHGLPAALQARDAIIGLRMTIEERWRITASIEKLNKVVGRSALISRFISLFYAEVDLNGTMVYCNAGHNPPLLLHADRTEELSIGGLILGPNPDASYSRGYTTMDPGAVMVAYTDGITEAENPQGEPYGVARLEKLVRAHLDLSAVDIVEKVFQATEEFSRLPSPIDDQTVVVLKRPR